jgi:epoxyqueuosine reductase QueG
MTLQSRLKDTAVIIGAAYFGVADLSLTQQGKIMPYEKKLVSEYHRAVSIGVPLSSAVVGRIGDESDLFGLLNYRYHVYQVINPLIDHITARLSLILINEGHTAIPVPASQTLDSKNYYGLFSNKMAASLAGLGWIGKSCLLITDGRGPRVRWGTILTNAPLITGNPVKPKCGKCIKCVEICPAGAFTGRDFIPSEPRESRMIAKKCFDYFDERESKIGARTCGLCVYICPWGQKGAKK